MFVPIRGSGLPAHEHLPVVHQTSCPQQLLLPVLSKCRSGRAKRCLCLGSAPRTGQWGRVAVFSLQGGFCVCDGACAFLQAMLFFCSIHCVSQLLLSVPLVQRVGDKQQLRVSPRDAGREHGAGVTALAWQFGAEHLIRRAAIPKAPLGFEVRRLRSDTRCNPKKMELIFFFSLWIGRCGFSSASLIRGFSWTGVNGIYYCKRFNYHVASC